MPLNFIHKTPEENTENAIRKCLQSGKKQIKDESGGIIMNFSKCGSTLADAEKHITREAERIPGFPFDVIILHSQKKTTRF